MALLGRGLVLINGLTWVKHRRIVSHVFNVHKLKVCILGMCCNLTDRRKLPIIHTKIYTDARDKNKIG